MADLGFIPVVALTVVRFSRMVHLKSNGDFEFECEVEALVWDPTAVRLLLDEKIHRQPMVALIAPRGQE